MSYEPLERRRSGRSLTSIMSILVVVTSIFSVAAISLAAITYDRLDNEVNRANTVSDFNLKMIEVTQRSRVVSAEEFCRTTERIKANIRKVLQTASGRPDNDSPRQQQTLRERYGSLFRELDCKEEAKRLIRPLPPLPKPG